MCSGLICGGTTAALGAILVVASSIIGFYVIPNSLEETVIGSVVLLDDSEQLERFQKIPFALTFKVRVFNVTNAEEAVAGAKPELQEVGPYVYKLYQERVVEASEEDKLSYRIVLRNEFDSEASYPNTEDDLVHVVNVAYHGVLQVTAATMPGSLGMLNLAMNGVFGQYNAPVVATRVGDLLFDGMSLCANPGLLGGVACNLIRDMTTNIQNMEVQPDNSIKFSVLGYRNDRPSKLYNVSRGIQNPSDLGRIVTLDGEPVLPYWAGDQPIDTPTYCDMINGTDSGIFAPFVDKTQPLYALNTDICRSVELRYQNDLVYKGIPAARFSANEWFLDNDDGCFCLNVTKGINQENGCLLQGAMELFSCVGAYMVLSYPHFLYADNIYRDGVVGMSPVEDDHRIFVDIEPNTGTVVRGAKRAQFNVFMRAISGIPATQNLPTTLTPLLWIEEGTELSDDFVDMLKDDLISTLNLLNILVPVAVALSCLVLLTGITIVICVKCRKKTV